MECSIDKMECSIDVIWFYEVSRSILVSEGHAMFTRAARVGNS